MFISSEDFEPFAKIGGGAFKKLRLLAALGHRGLFNDQLPFEFIEIGFGLVTPPGPRVRQIGIVSVLTRVVCIARSKSRNDTRMAARHSAPRFGLGGLGAQPDRGMLAIAKLDRELLQPVAILRSADFAHARFA